MKHIERNHRISLTLLLAFVVFVICVVSVAIAGVSVYLLTKHKILIDVDGSLSLTYGMFIMGGISLAVSVILIALTGKLTLSYANRIINQINRLASGDFKARLTFKKPLSSHPTIIEITESFNKMAEELENTEMLRGDFINNFSHEFKTPIVSIAGFAKLLKRSSLSEEEKEEYLDIIEEQSLRLAAMATNVLHLTKYENQSILTDRSTFNLSEQIRSCILALEGKWSKKQVDFNLDFDEHLITADGDMLRHVWINLLDNAIKFSKDGSTVEIGILNDGSSYQVSVKNEGPTIPAEQQSRIFRKFYQADESHASEGHGIGLALVKKITELHGGIVRVFSHDGITVFTVILPVNS